MSFCRGSTQLCFRRNLCTTTYSVFSRAKGETFICRLIVELVWDKARGRAFALAHRDAGRVRESRYSCFAEVAAGRRAQRAYSFNYRFE